MQVFDQKRRHDHPHPVMHEADSRPADASRHRRSENRFRRLSTPRSDVRLRRWCRLDGVEIAVPVPPDAMRPVMQHSGVEVAKRQFPQVGLRPLPTQIQVGDHGSRMNGAELQVRGHPAGAGQVGPVAVLRVAVDAVARRTTSTARAPPPRRRRGRVRRRDRGCRTLDALGPAAPDRASAPIRGPVLRRVPPVGVPPALQERGEHFVGSAVVFGDSARRHQIGRSRRHQRHLNPARRAPARRGAGRTARSLRTRAQTDASTCSAIAGISCSGARG